MYSKEIMSQFAKRLTNDDTFRRLFHLSIVCCREEVHEQLQEIIGWGPNKEGAVASLQGDLKEPPPLCKYPVCFCDPSSNVLSLINLENNLAE